MRLRTLLSASIMRTLSVPAIALAAALSMTSTVEVQTNVYYVRAGATGANTGVDWTNAYPTLPSTLRRGATYYIADGTYGGYEFDDPASGSTPIYVYKATASEHGTSTGWSSAYGDGQAIFTSSLDFTQPYYVLDGKVGGGPGSYTSGHGFKRDYVAAESNRRGVEFSSAAAQISIAHIEVDGRNWTVSSNDAFYSLCDTCDFINISYAYVHGMSRVPILTVGSDNWIVEYSFLDKFCFNSSGQHCEIISASKGGGTDPTDNYIFRHNIFKNYESTGGLIFEGTNWDIYGNVFWWSSNQGSTTANNGAIGTWSNRGASDVSIHNNSFVGLNGGGSHRIFPIGPYSNVTAYNNLWYNSPGNGSAIFGSTVVHDYNWFSAQPLQSEPNLQVATALDPFLNLAGGIFELRFPTNAGKSLTAPFNTDPYGKPRGNDGRWDRGAYEYSGTTLTAPQPPTALRIIR